MSVSEKKLRKIIEFGDFQTPDSLARRVTKLVQTTGLTPNAIVEPTCGVGSFVHSALASFSDCRRIVAVDINQSHLDELEASLSSDDERRTELIRGDFFRMDWQSMIEDAPKPLLFVGNPPWVTNAELGILYSSNLPEKSNFQNRNGFDAISGKANFDISEWMLIHLLEWLGEHRGMVAMLCKTSVARKVLKHAWSNRVQTLRSSIHLIDAKKEFDVSVDACLFLCETGPGDVAKTCAVYSGIGVDTPVSSIGVHDKELVADVDKYRKCSHLDGSGQLTWRSGIKHDCAKVMELQKDGDGYRNGLGEHVDLEPTYLYPLYKSSDVAKLEDAPPRKWVLVTQQNVGQDTGGIKDTSPLTWKYLLKHSAMLDERRSSIYRKQPRFAIFGVGHYSFSPWKVAISGLYKKIHFKVLGPADGKPPIVDDTCYSIPCSSESAANTLADLLNSGVAKEFLESFIFWDSKRPINVDILRRLDLLKLAESCQTDLDLSGSLEFQRQRSATRQRRLSV